MPKTDARSSCLLLCLERQLQQTLGLGAVCPHPAVTERRQPQAFLHHGRAPHVPFPALPGWPPAASHVLGTSTWSLFADLRALYRSRETEEEGHSNLPRCTWQDSDHRSAACQSRALVISTLSVHVLVEDNHHGKVFQEASVVRATHSPSQMCGQ